MSHQVKVLSKNNLGYISYCSGCNCFHITFQNLYIEFSKKEFKAFQYMISHVDEDYWHNLYHGTSQKRKITLSTPLKHVKLIFNKQEFDAFSDLLLFRTTKPHVPLTILEIDYLLFLN